MRTDNMYTNVLQLQLKQRQTRHQSDIGTWYRVRVSTECFIKLMGLCYKTDGENKLNVWAPTVLFPQNVVPVGQNKTKKERTVKKRTTKPEAIVGIIDLAVEDPSTQAESSTMGARHPNGKGVGDGDEVLYISD
jgi:hypothetical protein